MNSATPHDSILHDSISLVLPVRNAESAVVAHITVLMEQLSELGIADAEVIVVDDGSRDRTPDLVVQTQSVFPQIRLARHDRPRGMESAGQTGLERATGTIVLILEGFKPARTDDLRQLLQISKDKLVAAARAESRSREPSAPLLRRLRSWGTTADQQFNTSQHADKFTSVQMIRRSHLQTLASPKGNQTRLSSETSFQVRVPT